MDNQPESFRQLKLKEDEVDGIAFHVDEKNSNEDRTAWNFTIMKLNEEENRDFSLHELGFKYQILHIKMTMPKFSKPLLATSSTM